MAAGWTKNPKKFQRVNNQTYSAGGWHRLKNSADNDPKTAPYVPVKVP